MAKARVIQGWVAAKYRKLPKIQAMAKKLAFEMSLILKELGEPNCSECLSWFVVCPEYSHLSLQQLKDIDKRFQEKSKELNNLGYYFVNGRFIDDKHMFSNGYAKRFKVKNDKQKADS